MSIDVTNKKSAEISYNANKVLLNIEKIFEALQTLEQISSIDINDVT